MLDLSEWKESKIEMTVAQYEAKLSEWYERGRADEREMQALKSKLNYDFNFGSDRFKSRLPEILAANNIAPAKEEVRA